MVCSRCCLLFVVVGCLLFVVDVRCCVVCLFEGVGWSLCFVRFSFSYVVVLCWLLFVVRCCLYVCLFVVFCCLLLFLNLSVGV